MTDPSTSPIWQQQSPYRWELLHPDLGSIATVEYAPLDRQWRGSWQAGSAHGAVYVNSSTAAMNLVMQSLQRAGMMVSAERHGSGSA